MTDFITAKVVKFSDVDWLVTKSDIDKYMQDIHSQFKEFVNESQNNALIKLLIVGRKNNIHLLSLFSDAYCQYIHKTNETFADDTNEEVFNTNMIHFITGIEKRSNISLANEQRSIITNAIRIYHQRVLPNYKFGNTHLIDDNCNTYIEYTLMLSHILQRYLNKYPQCLPLQVNLVIIPPKIVDKLIDDDSKDHFHDEFEENLIRKMENSSYSKDILHQNTKMDSNKLETLLKKYVNGENSKCISIVIDRRLSTENVIYVYSIPDGKISDNYFVSALNAKSGYHSLPFLRNTENKWMGGLDKNVFQVSYQMISEDHIRLQWFFSNASVLLSPEIMVNVWPQIFKDPVIDSQYTMEFIAKQFGFNDHCFQFFENEKKNRKKTTFAVDTNNEQKIDHFYGLQSKKKNNDFLRERSITLGYKNDVSLTSAFPTTSIFCGYLGVRLSSNIEWKRRYFAVNNNFLLCAPTEHAKKLERIIPLEGSHLSHSIKSSDMTFELGIRKQRYFFRAPSPSICHKWIISIEKACKLKIKDVYRFMYVLGESGFTRVVAAQHRTTGEYSAIKIVDKRIVNKKMLRTEIQILKKLDSPYIVQLYDIVEMHKFVYIVMEKCDGGELFGQIASLDGDHYSVADCCHIMHQIAEAVRYMHSQSIVHRDLKPENVLCVEPNSIQRIKVADFGISKFLNKKNINRAAMKTMVGTLYYTAPEILQKRKLFYGKEVDYWSIGVIMYILLCGYPPFYGDNDHEVRQKIVKENIEYEDEDWNHVPLPALRLVKGLLNRNPKKRFTCEDVLKVTFKLEHSESFLNSKRNLRQTVIFGKFRSSMSRYEQDPNISRRIALNNAEFYKHGGHGSLMNDGDIYKMVKQSSIRNIRSARCTQIFSKAVITSIKAADDMLQNRNDRRRASQKMARRISSFRGMRKQSRTTDELDDHDLHSLTLQKNQALFALNEIVGN